LNAISGSGIPGQWSWAVSTHRKNVNVDIIVRDCRLIGHRLKIQKLPYKPEYTTTPYSFTEKLGKRSYFDKIEYAI
jgi:hypothetical protein